MKGILPSVGAETPRAARGKLAGKTAIVTGSTSGIGRATAVLMGAEGANVVVHGLDTERERQLASEVVREIETCGGRAVFVLADMSDLESPKKVFDACMDAFGTVDILHNNAGILSPSGFFDVTAEELKRVLTVNFISYVLLSQLCAEVMKEKGGGSIVHTASASAFQAKYGSTGYCTSKHAVLGLTKSMALQLGPEIRVNCVCPGTIRTGMTQAIERDPVIQEQVSHTALLRIGTAKDVAKAVLFLVSDRGSFVNGQAIRVDGGIDL